MTECWNWQQMRSGCWHSAPMKAISKAMSCRQAGLTLVGILGIRDEVRPEAIEAIAEVQDAGVQIVMITGDRRETAVAIAKDARPAAASE